MEKPKRSPSIKTSKHDKSRQVRNSADVVSVIRYNEGKREHPLICDPYAHLFVSPAGEEMLRSALERWPFFSDYLIVRAKFIDDYLMSVCEKEAIKQVVILGAGNDMRAARLPFLMARKVFEVDYPDRITHKKNILIKALEKLPENTVYAGADIRKDNLTKILSSAGFMITKKAVFIMEGLIYYLDSAGVDHLFEELSHLPSLGTIFLLDHISQDMSQKSHDPEKRIKQPYPEDPLDYLIQKGFKIVECVLLGNLTEKYFGKSHSERWWAITCKI